MLETVKKIEVIDENSVRVTLRSDGIIHVIFKENTEINSSVQSILLDAYLKLTGGNRSLFIFEGSEFVSLNKEVDKNVLDMFEFPLAKASAVVVTNLAQKLIADHFFNSYQPKHPSKVFHSFVEAIAWLKEQNVE
jgi:hypothetical protein